jgi:hypothetical protein
MTLSELKEILKTSAHGFYKQTIYSNYPLETQLNVANGIETEADMVSYISGKKTEYSNLIDSIDSLSTTGIYDNFTTDTDANMKIYVAGIMTDLTTDDQKICVAVGLQNMMR